MSRTPKNPGQWPPFMRAETAAAYVDERSVEAFLNSVPKLYPRAITVSGKGPRWLKKDLDGAIAKIAGAQHVRIGDASDVL